MKGSRFKFPYKDKSKYLIVRYHKDPIVEVDIGIGSKNLKLGLKNTKIEN